jgi:hypothetical protein
LGLGFGVWVFGALLIPKAQQPKSQNPNPIEDISKDNVSESHRMIIIERYQVQFARH